MPARAYALASATSPSKEGLFVLQDKVEATPSQNILMLVQS